MNGRFLSRALLAAACLCGCSTETTLRVRPENDGATAQAGEPLPGSVALLVHDPRRAEDNPTIGGARGDLTRDFVESLRKSGLFREVHYPVLSTHRFQMTMEVEQRCSEEVPLGTRLLAVPTVLTLGLIGPLFTHHMDSHVEAVVRLKVRSETVATYTAETDARFGYHWGWRNPDRSQGLRACVDATHAQLVRKMVADRDRLAALLAGSSPRP